MEDVALQRLLAGMRASSPSAFEELALLAAGAAERVRRRYANPMVAAGALEDTRLKPVDLQLDCGQDYLIDVVARSTSMQHLERMLAKRAREWADDGENGAFGQRILRNICEMPTRWAERFRWIVMRRLMGLVDGPDATRTVEPGPLAARLALTDEGRAAVADYRRHEREAVGALPLRDVVTQALALHDAAAEPEALQLVLLLLWGRADTRPAVLRNRDDARHR